MPPDPMDRVMVPPRYRWALGSIKAATDIRITGHATMAAVRAIAARAIRAFGAIRVSAAIRDAGAVRNTVAAGAGIRAAATDAKSGRHNAKRPCRNRLRHGLFALWHSSVQNQPSNFPSDIAKKTIAMKKQIF